MEDSDRTSRYTSSSTPRLTASSGAHIRPALPFWSKVVMTILGLGFAASITLVCLYAFGVLLVPSNSGASGGSGGGGGEGGDGSPRIQLDTYYLGSAPDSNIQSLVAGAVATWQTYVRAMDSGVIVPDGFTYCGSRVTIPDPGMYTEGIMIYFQIESGDGIGNVLGRAGPCVLIDDVVRLGLVILDQDDLNFFINTTGGEDTVSEILIHEIGHVLGLGTLWVANETYNVEHSEDGYPYQETNANAAHVAYGGEGPNARVEDDGGAGTAGGHWKEDVYEHEIMTGYVEGAGIHNVMSRLTLGGLKDLGYDVDDSVTDGYVMPARRRLRTRMEGAKVHYRNDTDLGFSILRL